MKGRNPKPQHIKSVCKLLVRNQSSVSIGWVLCWVSGLHRWTRQITGRSAWKGFIVVKRWRGIPERPPRSRLTVELITNHGLIIIIERVSLSLAPWARMPRVPVIIFQRTKYHTKAGGKLNHFFLKNTQPTPCSCVLWKKLPSIDVVLNHLSFKNILFYFIYAYGYISVYVYFWVKGPEWGQIRASDPLELKVKEEQYALLITKPSLHFWLSMFS